MMSAFQEHKEELEHFEQMFGRERGRLAVSLDRITNALVLVRARHFQQIFSAIFSRVSDGNFAGVPRKFRAIAPLPRRLRVNLQKRI